VKQSYDAFNPEQFEQKITKGTKAPASSQNLFGCEISEDSRAVNESLFSLLPSVQFGLGELGYSFI
jgi:hypothetical protein